MENEQNASMTASKPTHTKLLYTFQILPSQSITISKELYLDKMSPNEEISQLNFRY